MTQTKSDGIEQGQPLLDAVLSIVGRHVPFVFLDMLKAGTAMRKPIGDWEDYGGLRENFPFPPKRLNLSFQHSMQQWCPSPPGTRGQPPATTIPPFQGHHPPFLPQESTSRYPCLLPRYSHKQQT